MKEANIVLDNVLEDISGRDKSPTGSTLLTPLACMQTFITDCLPEKLVAYANRVLRHRERDGTTMSELRGIVVLHALCAM